MDKSWIALDDRNLPQYVKGVHDFLGFAYSLKDQKETIKCPCRRCNNVYYQTRDDVEADLFQYGFAKDYVIWTFHGEEFDDSHNDRVSHDIGEGNDSFLDTQGMLEDLFAPTRVNDASDGSKTSENSSRWESEIFMRLLRDADQELYPGCKSFSKLSFVVTLMHKKILSKWSNKSFSMLLEVLKKALPDGESLPSSYYEAKKMIQGLGLDYEKIDACVNDCVLFRKEYEKAEECPNCLTPRYKFTEVAKDKNDGKNRKKVAQKILRYFPLKPRLQKLFIFKKTAQDMRWHKEKRKDDGVLRHPADAQEWKDFDKKYGPFGQEPRNVRLGLASDGFNPFSNMSLSHSTWPVILLPYNLPPWKCLKAPFFILSMLIPGPKSPGNDIDVFLGPLVDELKELWEHGIETYDASTNATFNLRAALLWTINDFPAYGNLSGWSTKGYLACPVCNKETCSRWLPNGKKVCYMGHRRFLSADHKWRSNRISFDGKAEYKAKPIPLTEEDIVEQMSNVQPVVFGKVQLQQRKRKRDVNLNWTKHSIFFELPYWKSLNLRHNLDVMHIEKNVCDSILGTLLDISGKTKDNINARFDLQEMGIRHQLHPKLDGNHYLVPPACYTMTKAEKRKMCAFLASVKYPDAYASSLSKRINSTTCHVSGLKTHDCHVILQQLLPISVRGLLDNNICEALHEISWFFRQICSKTLKVADLKHMESQIGLTLCKLERIFPPSFFDIMMHLPVHLVREVVLGGPVQYRWMYPIERYLYRLKQYITNKAHPEGSMAEGYIAEECLTFCSMYMNDIETQFNKVERNYERQKDGQNKLFVFSDTARPLTTTGDYVTADAISLKQMHSYVLKNCDDILEYMSEHKEILAQNGCRDVEKEHEESFAKWFEKRIMQAESEGRLHHQDLKYLAYGPDERVIRHHGCTVNGLRFRTQHHDSNKRTQNYGVAVKADESGTHYYYGVLVDIVQLNYLGDHQVMLFKCDWYEGRSVQRDKFNYTSVNMSKPWKTNEPFVLATQAEQVYYVNDIKLGNDWKVVIHAQARGLWNVVENTKDEFMIMNESIQQNESHFTDDMIQLPSDLVEWSRSGVPSSTISSTTVTSRRENPDEDEDEVEEQEQEAEDADDGDDDDDNTIARNGIDEDDDDDDFDV